MCADIFTLLSGSDRGVLGWSWEWSLYLREGPEYISYISYRLLLTLNLLQISRTRVSEALCRNTLSIPVSYQVLFMSIRNRIQNWRSLSWEKLVLQSQSCNVPTKPDVEGVYGRKFLLPLFFSSRNAILDTLCTIEKILQTNLPASWNDSSPLVC